MRAPRSCCRRREACGAPRLDAKAERHAADNSASAPRTAASSTTLTMRAVLRDIGRSCSVGDSGGELPSHHRTHELHKPSVGAAPEPPTSGARPDEPPASSCTRRGRPLPATLRLGALRTRAVAACSDTAGPKHWTPLAAARGLNGVLPALLAFRTRHRGAALEDQAVGRAAGLDADLVAVRVNTDSAGTRALENIIILAAESLGSSPCAPRAGPAGKHTRSPRSSAASPSGVRSTSVPSRTSSHSSSYS